MLIYSDKYQGWGKQKPQQWGPASAIKSSMQNYFENSMGVSSSVLSLPLIENSGLTTRDYASDSLVVGDGVQWQNRSLYFDNTATNKLYLPYSQLKCNDLFTSGNNKATILFRFKANGLGGSNLGRIITKETSWIVYLSTLPPNVLEFQKKWGTTAGTWRVTFGLNTVYDYAISYNGSSVSNIPSFVVNKNVVSIYSSTSPVGTAYSDTTIDMYIGNNSGLLRHFYGLFDYFYIIKDTIPIAKIQSFQEAPYAAIQPYSAPVYFFQGGGATYDGVATDGFLFADDNVNSASLQAVALDGLSLGESPSNIAAMLSSITDGIIFSDSGSVVSTISVSISDGITGSDSASNTATMLITAVDGVSLGDSLSAITLLLASCTDGVTLSDVSIQELLGLIGVATDGFNMGDSSGSISTAFPIASSGFKFSDSVLSLAQFIISISDGISFSDIISLGSAIEAAANDGILIGESTATTLQMILSAIDGLSASDSATTTATINVTCSDSAMIGAALTAIMQFSASCADIFKLGDVAVHIQAHGLITVSFAASRAKIVFTVSQPSMAFSVTHPNITFNA